MQLHADRLLHSPSDLSAHLACEHLTRLELEVARGERTRPELENPQADLIKRKGDEHETAYLGQLRAHGRNVTTIERGDGAWELERAAADTLAAMRAGADVVFQAVLLSHDGRWRGLADFLERVDTPSALGPWSYEVADTKLARHSKPTYILQLCFYTEQVAPLQELEPAAMHVLLGSGERESFRPADFGAYYRRVRARFIHWMSAPPHTYPLPVPHCNLCDFREECEARWEADDHLTLVTGMRRDQVHRLEERGVVTLAQLAAAPEAARPLTMQPRTFTSLRDQAELQLLHRRTGRHETRLLAPESRRGLALLPPASPGDLFFDIEGDPFWAPVRGLEYLWGVVDTSRRFHAFWAHDEAEERRALERFVAFVHARLHEDPHLHVYHYASYEPAALKRLMGLYGTCEDEIDDLLRREVFVDLYKVVRQGLRSSHPNLSLKSIEQFFFTRTVDLQSGGDSIVLYEQWLDERQKRLLDEIAAYNEEDCLATLELRNWLLERRREAEQGFGPIAWPSPPELSEPRETAAETAELRARLEAEGSSGHVLAARLLDYHRREAKPVWWAFFDRRGRTPEELAERDGDAIGMLELVGRRERGEGELCTLSFPAQQHKLFSNQGVHDPATLDYAGQIERLDDEAGELDLFRSKTVRERPLPLSLVPGGPLQTKAQRAALRRLGESILDGDGRYSALERILSKDPPRVAGLPAGAALPQDDLNAAKEIVARLDRSHLVVQGPPGSGKTYTGARLIVHLMRLRRRVGVCATSHKAIENLLREVERVAAEEGFRFRGFKKSGLDYDGPFVTTSGDDADYAEPEDDVLLLAGTAWLFAKPELEGVVDTLVVDEAGQVSLADALALGTCARNLVLLGDPQQLGQVSQGMHPEGAGASVLEHLLDGAQTIPPERGLFLGLTWRMHEDVCRFVSDTSYEGRLHPAEVCANQATSEGTGLRFLPVAHEGNRAASPEEAERIAFEIERLRRGTWTDCRGMTRPIRDEDILVVAPYNAQVRCLRAQLRPSIAVGTVDKFQGQEAPIVFFSMATSSGDDLPRNVEFLFSRNRLNVAISRARCLAFLVASPDLLEIRCRTVEQMRMVNALCRFVELAGRTSQSALQNTTRSSPGPS